MIQTWIISGENEHRLLSKLLTEAFNYANLL